MERTNLKVFRVKQKMSQEEIAVKVGVSRGTYASIETGKRNGNNYFWKCLQKSFNIPDAEMWELMKKDGE